MPIPHPPVCSEIWCGVVEAVHGDLVAEEAAGVGGEGPEEDGDGALGEGARALLAHHVLEDVAHAAVRALGRCNGTTLNLYLRKSMAVLKTIQLK